MAKMCAQTIVLNCPDTLVVTLTFRIAMGSGFDFKWHNAIRLKAHF